MRRIYLAVSDDAFTALADLAHRERRDTRDQAAVLLEQVLQRREPVTPAEASAVGEAGVARNPDDLA